MTHVIRLNHGKTKNKYIIEKNFTKIKTLLKKMYQDIRIHDIERGFDFNDMERGSKQVVTKISTDTT